MSVDAETFELASPVALLSDVHGNRWALEAVLREIDRQGIHRIINLGDSLYGPLDPAGTARIMRSRNFINIRGNQDRALLEAPSRRLGGSPTLQFVIEQLSDEDLQWVAAHRAAAYLLDDLLLCHGTPTHDDVYLAEEIGPAGAIPRTDPILLEMLGSVVRKVVCFGHSHLPILRELPNGMRLVNPGSVGLPAFADDHPMPHVMEAGSPHARYAVLHQRSLGWGIDHKTVPYDWDRAASTAARNGRKDWSHWLRTGRATG